MSIETANVFEALEDLNATIDADLLEMNALQAIDQYGPNPAMESLFDAMGHVGIVELHEVLSEEGLVDYVKDKVGKLVNKFQIFTNSIYAKFKSNDAEFQRKLAQAKASGDGSGLPIGKAASIIAGLGALAAAGAAATFGAKALSGQGNVKEIRAKATAASKELKERIQSKFSKTGAVPENELKSLHQRLQSNLKRGLSTFGQHLKTHRGEYAAAAAATAAVSGTAAYALHERAGRITARRELGESNKTIDALQEKGRDQHGRLMNSRREAASEKQGREKAEKSAATAKAGWSRATNQATVNRQHGDAKAKAEYANGTKDENNRLRQRAQDILDRRAELERKAKQKKLGKNNQKQIGHSPLAIGDEGGRKYGPGFTVD